MRTLVLNFIQNWPIPRLLRLILGVAFAIVGWREQDYFQASIGGIFLFQAVANVSCIGGACAPSYTPPKTDQTSTDKVSFEEVK